jgi:hypothetical protein
MQLGTFGAIMTFAMQLEEQGVTLYGPAMPSLPEDARTTLLRGSRKRLKRLERAKREGVAEMILEPISGLDDSDFHVEESGDAMETAMRFEATCIRYYREAAEKLPILEISRLFERMAEGNESRIASLKEAASP